jgi:uncharacterized membrane protein YhaH (DUF805 family)
MATANPYLAPQAAVGDVGDQQYQPVRTFSASGRIGRARYIGYSIGWAVMIGMLAGVLMAFAKGTGMAPVVAIAMLAAYVLLFVIQFLLSIQRCHDFNTSGWASLLILIPLVNLLFWFLPGTPGANRFGPPPPPNTVGVILGALILPLVFVVGIVAAVAIPAYQQYVERARAVQHN